ncbi:MAG: hypothetical protein GOU98_02080 [Candidatus Altiarchaeota archaeon]|nr:hypothetical protein [Candidatus Altiarchaeota archaeon]
MVSLNVGRIASSLKPSPLTAGKIAFTLVMAALISQFFKISLEIDSKFSRSMDSGYPYLQAVGMHHVNGRPFMEYLSLALIENSNEVDGVNIITELEKFGERFILLNSSGSVVLEVGESTGRDRVLAVPPGGSLVIRYEWN